jgi:FkbM family methyltransferase
MNALKHLALQWLPASAIMSLRAYDHYFSGEPELRLLKQLCPAGCVAVDAGANIGVYSYFLRKIAATVYAYEPNPELAAQLNRSLPGVRVRNVALSDREGFLQLHVPVGPDNGTLHELASVAGHLTGPTVDYTVQTVTLDAEKLANVGFIKVDVEQHEREVLRGSVDTLRRCRPVVMVEVYPLRYESALGQEFGALIDMGYAAWFNWEGRWLPLSELRADVHLDPANFGNPKKFIGNNLLLFPSEHPLASKGPA